MAGPWQALHYGMAIDPLYGPIGLNIVVLGGTYSGLKTPSVKTAGNLNVMWSYKFSFISRCCDVAKLSVHLRECLYENGRPIH